MANPRAGVPAQPPPSPRSPGAGASTHDTVAHFPSTVTPPEAFVGPPPPPDPSSFVGDPPPPLSSELMATSPVPAAASTAAGRAEVSRLLAQVEAAQDSMESKYRSLFTDISPCVVIVEQVRRLDYFCVGSVIQSEHGSTFILTQSSILHSYSAVELTVRFSDGLRQPASPVFRNDLFCILRTSFHNKCKAIELFRGEINHTYAAAIAPASSSSAHNMTGFIIQKLILASDDVPGILLPEKHFFVFACRYGDTCPSGECRLISGPAFNMDSKVLGFILKDDRYKQWPRGKDGEINYEDDYCDQAFYLKICLASSHLDEMLGNMVGDDDWRKALKLLAHTA